MTGQFFGFDFVEATYEPRCSRGWRAGPLQDCGLRRSASLARKRNETRIALGRKPLRFAMGARPPSA